MKSIQHIHATVTMQTDRGRVVFSIENVPGPADGADLGEYIAGHLQRQWDVVREPAHAPAAAAAPDVDVDALRARIAELEAEASKPPRRSKRKTISMAEVETAALAHGVTDANA